MDTQRSMTRSPVALARMALRVAHDALPVYSTKYSRQDFTQHQLFAILMLRLFFKTDYRGITALLEDLPDLCRVLKLTKVPHYSTLCYAEQRLLKKGLLTDCSTRFSALLEKAA
jgi:hypothetical protein